MSDFIIELIEDGPIKTLEVGIQGPPGTTPGIYAVAGETIGKDQIIRSDPSGKVFLADSSTDIGDILGVSQNNVIADQVLQYTTIGSIPFAPAVPPKIYYLGSGGNFTESVTVDGLFKIMGVCHTPGFITLQPNPTIRRHQWL